MSHTRSFRASALALAVLGALVAGQAGATGFQLREQSVKNRGKSNAGSIVGKDASNVSLNPAAMTNLDKNTFQSDITVIDLTADFNGSGRYLLGAFPMAGFAAERLSGHRLATWTYLLISAVLLVVLTTLFGRTWYLT